MYNDKFCSAIIVAAGQGRRMGTKVSKQFLEFEGKPILAYTLKKFQDCKEIDEIIIVTNEENIDYCKLNIVDRYSFDKVKDIVAGGSERQFSVYNGIMQVSKSSDIVLIHDGVRPFVKIENILDTIKGAIDNRACILGVKAKDTIKITNKNNIIINTPNRDDLWHIQTPQAFEYKLIKESYESALKDGIYVTDDAMIVERLGIDVMIAEGSYDNIKITTMEDLILCNALIESQFKNWR